jgi:hypothetical protein
MILQTAYFQFVRSESPGKALNQTLALVCKKLDGIEHRIINVETVEPKTFLGFQLQAGGLRIWYEAESRVTVMEMAQPLFDEINT